MSVRARVPHVKQGVLAVLVVLGLHANLVAARQQPRALLDQAVSDFERGRIADCSRAGLHEPRFAGVRGVIGGLTTRFSGVVGLV